MRFDRREVYDALVHHLRDDVEVAAKGDAVLLPANGLELRIRTSPERPPSEDDPATFVWLDVDGIQGLAGTDRPGMSLDLSGWGSTQLERAIDLAHGVAETIVPAIRWLARDPQIHGALLADAEAWEIFVGDPWITVAGEAAEAGGLADVIRASEIGDAASLVLRIGDVIEQALPQHVPHWVKVYVANLPAGFDGRIDLDNEYSWPGTNVAESYAWPSSTAIQLVRRLVVLRPTDVTVDPSPPGPAGRARGLRGLLGAFRSD